MRDVPTLIAWLRVCAVLVVCPGAAPGQAAPALERHGHRAEILDGTVYAFGGYARAARDRAARQLLAWQPGAAAWAPRAEMAAGRAFFGSAVVGGALYAVGSTIERYDPEKDAWTSVQEGGGLPRSHHAVAAFRGRLHIVGGIPDDAGGHHVFDPSTGSLDRAPPPPGFARGDHLHILVTLGDRLHCVGGSGAGERHAAFDGETWRERAVPPAPLWAKFAVYAVVERSLFVFAENVSLRYDADTDRWREVAPLPGMLAMPAAVVRDGTIEVLGGRRVQGGGYGSGRYDLARDRWILPGESPAPTAGKRGGDRR